MVGWRSGKQRQASAGFPDVGRLGIAGIAGRVEPSAPSTPDSLVPPAVECSAVGREAAFRRYVEPELDVLLRAAHTLTGSWADAEDVVQDTLVRAWQAIDRFDGAHPRAWLLTIMRNAQRNGLRRKRPELTGDHSYLEGQQPAFGAGRIADPEQRHTDLEFSAPLDRAIHALDPRFRTALLLIDVDQLTYAEAAGLLGLPAGTVMSRLSRARDKIRRRLSDEGTAP